MSITITNRLKLTRWGADTDEVTRQQFVEGIGGDGGLVDQLEELVFVGLQGTASARPAAGVARRAYYEIDTGLLQYDDGTQWRVIGSRFANAIGRPATATDVALTLQGVTGQSGQLQVWLDPAGATLAGMTAAGLLSARSLAAVGGAGTALAVTGTDAAQVVAFVKGAAGQTADLQRWLNNGSQVLIRFTAAGGVTAAGDVTSAGQLRGATVTSDGDVAAAGQVRAATGRFTTDVAAPNLTGSATSGVALHNHRQRGDTSSWAPGAASKLSAWSAVSQQGPFQYADGVWTIPATGRWRVGAQVSFSQNGTGTRLVEVWVNDAYRLARDSRGACSDDYTTISLTAMGILQAGDKVEIRPGHSAPVNLQVGAPARATFDYEGAAP